MAEATPRAVHYSPDRRTALVLSGHGVDGAYHAGALRALSEAGVRLDLLAGHGIGAVGALFGAIDGGARLWEPAGGLWRPAVASTLYAWRPALRRIAWGLAGAAALLTVPVAALAAGTALVQGAVLLDGLWPGLAAEAARWWSGVLAAALAPQALPARLPQAVALVVAVLTAGVLVAGVRARRAVTSRRGVRGGLWWTILGAPLSSAAPIVTRGLWDLLRGGAQVSEPPPAELSRRYAELLADGLDQPGFHELLLLAHDLDARQDLVFALLATPWRRAFFLRRQASGSDRRSAEAVDLAGASRDHVLDAVCGAVSIPGATDPHLIAFAPESYWRGETHRLCARPGALLRLLEEVAGAGVRQVVLVTASEALGTPHALSRRRLAPRARLGDYLASAEGAAVRDAVAIASGWFDALFVVRPAHNPVAPLDSAGAFDERSDRAHGVRELVDRGYEDAYRQFIDPMVGASGEQMAAGDPVRSAE